MKLYRYVGPEHLRDLADDGCPRLALKSREDVQRWLAEEGAGKDHRGSITVTFVVDESGLLWIADRHAEHIACARGGPVQSAGELTFGRDGHDGSDFWVDSATNQSTGYCPQPSSWPAVQGALVRAGFTPPDGFLYTFVFRRCGSCDTINIVKEGVFVCGVCDAALSATWNLDAT